MAAVPAPAKTVLKKLRASPAFNSVATSALRTAFRLTGRESRFITSHFYRLGLVEDRLPNGRTIRFWTEGDDLIPNEIFWHGWDGHEGETVRLFYRLAERSRGTLDIGSHIGLFTLLAAHANPQGRVVAFEPMPPVYERLRRNVKLNELRNVACINAAAGLEAGSAEFYYNTGIDLPDSSSMRAECTEAFRRFSTVGEIKQLTVKVARPDDVVRSENLQVVDLVKIDTEGTEADALRGLQETLSGHRPHIVCEVLRGFKTEEPLMALLGRLGYRYYLLTGAGPEPRDRIEGQPDRRWECRNYLFTRMEPAEVAAV